MTHITCGCCGNVSDMSQLSNAFSDNDMSHSYHITNVLVSCGNVSDMSHLSNAFSDMSHSYHLITKCITKIYQ